MSKNNIYEAPESNLEIESEAITRDETRGRRAYLFQLFMIWILLPLLSSFLITTLGLGEGAITETINYNQNNELGQNGYFLDLLYVWYLQIPLYIYYTRNRVLDTGLSPWFTLLFILPVINMALLFWPPNYK